MCLARNDSLSTHAIQYQHDLNCLTIGSQNLAQYANDFRGILTCPVNNDDDDDDNEYDDNDDDNDGGDNDDWCGLKCSLCVV